MDLAFILTSLAVFILVAAFVARPLIEKMTGTEPEPSPADALISQREAVLIELRDLDFDHSTGKMNEDDYQEQRTRLTAKGVEILRALDALAVTMPTATDTDDIEQLVALKRGKKSAAPVAASAASATTADKLFCTQCGTPAQPTDKFCAKCGTNLQKVWQD